MVTKRMTWKRVQQFLERLAFYKTQDCDVDNFDFENVNPFNFCDHRARCKLKEFIYWPNQIWQPPDVYFKGNIPKF